MFQGSRRRKNDKHTKGKKDSAGEQKQSGSVAESAEESSEHDSTTKSDEESSCVSDDSLEVVIVKRSLEKTCEKIISGRKSKTPRDDSKSSKSDEKTTSTKSKKRDKSPPVAKPRKGLSPPQQQNVFDGDSTSQDTVEQVTVTVDVHEDRHDSATTMTEREEMQSKMEDILEKADELQSALLTKAADLKKGVEEMRHQMSTQQRTPESDDKKDSSETKSCDSTAESSSAKEESPKMSEEKRKSLETATAATVREEPEAPKAAAEHFTTTDSDQVEIKATETTVTEEDGAKKSSITVEVTETKRGSLTKTPVVEEDSQPDEPVPAKETTSTESPKKDDDKSTEMQTQSSIAVTESSIPGTLRIKLDLKILNLKKILPVIKLKVRRVSGSRTKARPVHRHPS